MISFFCIIIFNVSSFIDLKSSSTFIEAMKTLINMIEALSQELEIKTQKLIDQMLDEWYSMLHSKLYDSIKLSRAV